MAGLDSGVIWIVTEESVIPQAVLFREGEGFSPRSASKRLLKEPNGISHAILRPDVLSHACCALSHRLISHYWGDGLRKSLRVHVRAGCNGFVMCYVKNVSSSFSAMQAQGSYKNIEPALHESD